MPDNVKMGYVERTLELRQIVRASDDEPTKLSFAASSEAPVARYFGDEVLSHEKSAIRLERVTRGAMPLLFNHDWNDPIGMIDAARIEQGRLVVDAHLFDTERAREIEQMLRGGLKNVSLGYRLHEVSEDKKTHVFTATDWEPYEVSIVTVPADPSVGIGRAFESGEKYEVRMLRASDPADSANYRKGTAMPDQQQQQQQGAAGNGAADQQQQQQQRGGGGSDQAVLEAQQRVLQMSAQELEGARRKAIENLCKANRLGNELRDHWISTGSSIEQVSEDILRVLEERGKRNPQPASRLGLTDREVQTFSLARAIQACAAQNWTHAPFELECTQALQNKLNRVPDPKRFLVPFEVLERPIPTEIRALLASMGRRDLTVAAAGAGGYLVSTENVGFIELLRNRSVAMRLGARRLSGLVGSVTVPRMSVGAAATWLANEASTATEQTQTFVQMALTPKNVAAYTEISRQLLLQSSPAVEGIVSDDLSKQVALAADLAAIEGSGAAGQPTGISNTAGIGSVTGTSLAAAGVLEFQSDVAAANVIPTRPGYVTTPAVAALLMARPELPSTGTTRLWKGSMWDGSLFDLPAMSSNQPTAASMIFGDWNELVIGEWGVLEVEVNPYANFQAGIIGVRAIYSMDVGVRRPFAFSRATSIT